MKLLVFAHTPPPHHGQSYMVQLMLDGFGGDCRKSAGTAALKSRPYGVECYHVNARVSKELEDIGGFRLGKLFLLLGYCLQAVWCRFRHGVTTFYYVPAPGKASALYRDWLVMLLCRPFFPRLILHWHAAGLADWLETHVPLPSRIVTYHRLRDADLSLVLSNFNRADAEKLLPKDIRVVNNGIPDPCPDFDQTLRLRRQARSAARRKLAAGLELSTADREHTGGDPRTVNILYLAHCTREKGLFDTLNGVLKARKILHDAGSPFSLQLQVAGGFARPSEREEFDRLLATPEARGVVQYLGFVQGEAKEQALRNADLLCFPSYYQNENQPVNLIEAMAYGLPALTTRWRSLPELFPPDYPCLVDIQSPDQIASALARFARGDVVLSVRELYLRHFTIEQYLAGLARALQSVQPRDHGAAASAPDGQGEPERAARPPAEPESLTHPVPQ